MGQGDKRLLDLFFGQKYGDILPNLLITVNTATLFYALIVYSDATEQPWIRGMLFIFVIMISAGLRLDYNGFRSQAGQISEEITVVNIEFLVSILMNLVFFGVDAIRSSKESPSGDWHTYFAAWYISAPTTLSLLIARSFYWTNSVTSVGWRPGASISYLSGVAFSIVLMSNLVFGLLAWPRWGTRLKVELTGESRLITIVWPKVTKLTRLSMRNILVIAFCASIIAVLAGLAAISVTFVPGVAALYPATAFEAAFGSWFGVWGAFASYIGLLVAGSLSGWFSILVGLLLACSDFMLSLFTGLGMRFFKIDPALPTFPAALAFFSISWGCGSVPSSIFYNLINLKLGVLEGEHSFWVAVIGWNVGNAIVLAFLGIPLMKLGTSTVRRFGLSPIESPK